MNNQPDNPELKQQEDEQTPPDVDAKPVEVISLDVEEEGEQPAELAPETTQELLDESLEEAYVDELARHTDDPTVQASLAARQELDSSPEESGPYLAKSPELTAGDVDAGWQQANVGDETPGGTVPTPDQDIVDNIGQAVGLTYEDDEPLNTAEKLTQRDEERWELDPESTEAES